MSNNHQYPIQSDLDKDRLHGQHEVIKSAMGGSLVMAPVDLSHPDICVLDSATSDGFWLQDFRKDYPAPRTLIGTDIDISRFPSHMPEGISLQQQDMHQPWPAEWKDKFDFVHQRLVLLGSMGDPQPIVNRLLELVKPGGWVQMVEADQSIGESDGPAMQQFMATMTAMSAAFGTPLKYASNITMWLKEAGFQKIGESIIPYSIGAAQPKPELRQKSVRAFAVAVTGIAQYCKIHGGVPGVSTGDLDTLVPRCEAELNERGGYFPMRCVWGQKPL